MLEAYAAYWDYNDMMVLVENLFEEIALKLFGTTQLTFPSEEGESGKNDRSESSLEAHVDERQHRAIRQYRRRSA